MKIDIRVPSHVRVAINTEIFLDGVPLKEYIMADDRMGIVECYKRDVNGKLLLIGDHLVSHFRMGEVKIVLPEHWYYNKTTAEFFYNPYKDNP